MSFVKQLVEAATEEAVSEVLKEMNIADSFEKAMEKGEVTDILGNPLEVEELSGIDESLSREQNEAKWIIDCLKLLQGKVLTVIDASFDDERRAKYVKDLVREAFSTQGNWMFEATLKGHIFDDEERPLEPKKS